MAKGESALKAHLSSAEVWAFSLGTSVGWGSVIITCNTYLASAGPVGTIAGLIVGALVMLVVGRCYAYLMSRFPVAGGVYDYAKEAFGPTSACSPSGSRYLPTLRCCGRTPRRCRCSPASSWVTSFA